MQKQRRSSRVEYKSKAVLILCSSQQKFFIETDNISPFGMAIRMKENVPDIVGQDAIIITASMIMYVKIVRKEDLSENDYFLGLQSINFTPEVMEYITNSLG